MINIILQKKIKKLGEKYNIIKVKDGYALNYLIPNNYAVIATKSEININNEKLKQININLEKLNKKYILYINKLKKIKINFLVKLKKNNKIFGYITKKDIKKKLEENKIFINCNNIYMNKKINKIGIYNVKIKFLKNLNTKFKINIINSK
ncbi:MAG: 50S ribosomal protein L9 [Candidatus Shikimatogenerans bostrichidophilus]|nr:MAG: 50S ribosomal protein L9 [Candidatus Shikimatogenerans bostrichidophilus]